MEQLQAPDAFGIGRLFWVTSEAIVAADLESEQIVLWNPAAERLFGYTPAEALGMRLENLVPEELRDAHLAGIRRYRESGDAVLVGGPAIAVPALTKDGRPRQIALTLADVSDVAPGRRVLAVIRDVTPQHEAEATLAATNAAMREFVATASHDLRSPLASVLGYAALLKRDMAVSAEERLEFLETIERNAKHAVRLVDDLLTLSEIQAGVLGTYIESVRVADAAHRALAAVSVPATVSDDGLAVAADPDHLDRMLVNYLTNAQRYGAEPLRIAADSDGRWVRICVCDAGHGVAPEFEDRLFTSFARGNAATGRGAGLGLSIVKGLAEANGGSAFYERSAEGGCCFGIKLPAAAA